jgi:hypothetical protein
VQTLRAFRSSRRRGVLHARAFLWAAACAPRLLHERPKRTHFRQGEANAASGQTRS